VCNLALNALMLFLMAELEIMLKGLVLDLIIVNFGVFLNPSNSGCIYLFISFS